MKKFLFLTVLSLSFSALADIAADEVVLRTMDKITGRVQKITVGIGEQTKVGSLTVHVEKCLRKPPEETPENAAFLTIMDEDAPQKPVFHGWMFSSNPALSAMEHPVYDIWVVECGAAIKEKSVPEQNLEKENSSEETETAEPIED